MLEDRERIIEQIVGNIRVVMRTLHSAGAANWLQLDLTMSQLKALFALAAQGPMTIGSLGQKLGVQLPAASHVADSMVQIGLAERYEDTEDRRRTFMRLSPSGQSLADQLREGRREWIRAWLAELGTEDVEALARGVQAVADVITKHSTHKEVG